MKNVLVQIDYEKRGYRKGASAKLKLTGANVILVSNPKIEDDTPYVWVAMELDTYVRYKAKIDNLELL